MACRIENVLCRSLWHSSSRTFANMFIPASRVLEIIRNTLAACTTRNMYMYMNYACIESSSIQFGVQTNSSQRQPLPLQKHSFSMYFLFFCAFFLLLHHHLVLSSVISLINSESKRENVKENYNSFLIISIFHYHSRVTYHIFACWLPFPSNRITFLLLSLKWCDGNNDDGNIHRHVRLRVGRTSFGIQVDVLCVHPPSPPPLRWMTSSVWHHMKEKECTSKCWNDFHNSNTYHRLVQV